ncbi:heme ABC exporter ATP-binding protein CcmA [Stakelama sp. CBK3Z-3]|uniref:Heme ABC exporter ATP-binding protein CcmA n=1 Tax=Stakelama flava TaxID=2860338 RepID=A0ABS6XNS0_9SPHN|nr:heme ABC exporter ATP-binding protein CcmA [Stakelama flava]
MTPGGALAFRDVTCVRGRRTVFSDLSFAVERGGAALVRGPNGAGKSSLIRIAAGLLEPFEGTVAYTPPRALITEDSALDSELPVARALGFWASLDDSDRDRHRAVADALAAFGLSDLAHVPVRLLSTGQRRRACLARVVAADAPTWLLDEPANGLDSASLATLETLIARHRKAGGAVVIATHLPLDLPRAQQIALGEG